VFVNYHPLLKVVIDLGQAPEMCLDFARLRVLVSDQ